MNNSTSIRKNIYLDTSWGVFVGIIQDNIPHKHFAIQLSISLEKNIIIKDQDSNTYLSKNVLIKSNITHEIACNTEQLLLLINPTSSLGHYLNQITYNNITSIEHPIINTLNKVLFNYVHKEYSFKNIIIKLKAILEDVKCECNHQNHYNDERIKKAIIYLEQNYNRVIPLEEIANESYLSPSRFIHLFKEKTGITYRRAQLWNKISRSFTALPHQNITETAHQFGFTDSAHYSKIFKQNFGFSPKLFLKK